MGTLKLIDNFQMYNLNKAEKATLAQTYKALVEEGTTSSTPDQPSVQSGEEGYQKLNIPEELWNRFCTAEEYMSDMTMQSTASEETPEMQAIAAKREKLVQVCVRRVLESEDMPIEDEQEAAKKLKIVVSPYKRDLQEDRQGKDFHRERFLERHQEGGIRGICYDAQARRIYR